MKTEKGITMVAVVMTIMVLIILAVVSVSYTLSEENGIFNKAKIAKNVSENKAIEENKILANYTNEIRQVSESKEESITISKKDYDTLLNKIENATTLDYDNKINISTYINANNKFIAPKNGIIQITGHGGYAGIYVNDNFLGYIQHATDLWQSYSTSVNKDDTMYFTLNNFIITAYYIPYVN